MKNSIDFLPERKQRDLHELAALIRDEVKDVVMIILYGLSLIHISEPTRPY